MFDLNYFLMLIFLAAVALLISTFRILREYERGVIFWKSVV